MTNYDGSNPKHIKIAHKSAKAVDDAERGFIIYIMERADGRTYVHNLLTSCHAFDQPFFEDPYKNAYWCGVRNIGLRLLADIMAYCPDYYLQMMREANARTATDDVRRSRSDKDSNGNDSGLKPYVHPAFDTGEQAGGDNRPAAGNALEYDPVERDEAGDES